MDLIHRYMSMQFCVLKIDTWLCVHEIIEVFFLIKETLLISSNVTSR
jgi:hypothetical protein